MLTVRSIDDDSGKTLAYPKLMVGRKDRNNIVLALNSGFKPGYFKGIFLSLGAVLNFNFVDDGLLLDDYEDYFGIVTLQNSYEK